VLQAESFTDVSTPVNSCGTQYFKKSSTTNATARPWVMVADGKTFYLGTDWNSSGNYDFVSAGDFASFVAGDAFPARLQGLVAPAPAAKGHYSSLSLASWEDYSGGTGSAVCPRPYSQVLGSISLFQGSLCAASMPSGANSVSYAWALSGNHGYASNQAQQPLSAPSMSDSGYHFVPVFLLERASTNRTLRGTHRGMLHVMEQLPIASGYQILEGVENVAGGLVLMVASCGAVWNAGDAYFPSTLAFSLGGW